MIPSSQPSASESALNYPAWCIDPMFVVLMTNPVTTPHGDTYERSEIEAWINQKGTDPHTREVLTKEQLRLNRLLKEQIDEYLASQKKLQPVVSASSQKPLPSALSASVTIPLQALPPEPPVQVEAFPEEPVAVIAIKSDEAIQQQPWYQVQQQLWSTADNKTVRPIRTTPLMQADLTRELRVAVASEDVDINAIRELLIKGAQPLLQDLIKAIKKNNLALSQLLLFSGVELKLQLANYVASLRQGENGSANFTPWLLNLIDLENIGADDIESLCLEVSRRGSAEHIQVLFGLKMPTEKMLELYVATALEANNASALEAILNSKPTWPATILLFCVNCAISNKNVAMMGCLLRKFNFTETPEHAGAIWDKALQVADNMAMIELLLTENIPITACADILTYVLTNSAKDKPKIIADVIARKNLEEVIELSGELVQLTLTRFGLTGLSTLVNAEVSMPANIFSLLITYFVAAKQNVTEAQELNSVELTDLHAARDDLIKDRAFYMEVESTQSDIPRKKSGKLIKPKGTGKEIQLRHMTVLGEASDITIKPKRNICKNCDDHPITTQSLKIAITMLKRNEEFVTQEDKKICQPLFKYSPTLKAAHNSPIKKIRGSSLAP